MELVADRFLAVRGARYLDIASGAAVLLRMVRHRNGSRPAWLDRCAVLAGVRHPGLPVLLDYGELLPGVGFEARRRAPLTDTVGRHAALVHRAALAFLADLGVDPGPLARLPICGRTPRRPDCAKERPGPRAPAPTRWIGRAAEEARARGLCVGVRLQRRIALDAVLETMNDARAGSVRRIRCAAPAGAGGRTFLLDVAREARRLGYVPLAVSVARSRPEVIAAVEDRHVVLLERLEPGDSPADGVDLLLRLAMRSSRPHLLLTVATAGAADCALDPLPVESLLSMVHLHPEGLVDRRSLERAAVASGGRPGRFLALIGGADLASARPILVAEARAVFGTEGPAVGAEAAPLAGPDEARWLARLDQAAAL
ncbi:MAG TPA: hypothetical protein VNK92_06550, partial [Vicinamibacterales bacterium]|nr:hypothetical protein [Vicinamibacterales bacterium]